MRKRAADLQPGDVVDLDEGLEGEPDIVTIEEVRDGFTGWPSEQEILLVWVAGDDIPVRLPPDNEFTIIKEG